MLIIHLYKSLVIWQVWLLIDDIITVYYISNSNLQVFY
ncbi:hypothetical protein [uncultured Gammaproteobacteria bacterium]|nr:hypothetical protein [uncultured Gammaproteobacteria bacterium]